MKKVIYMLPVVAMAFASCGGGETTDENPLDNLMTDNDDYQASALSFSEGGAEDGEQYFFGVLAEVVEVDVKRKEIDKLDEMDAPLEQFNQTMDSCQFYIDQTRKALDLYKDKDWPERQKLHDLTVEWLDAVDMLLNDHLRKLADPMSRPDDTWTDAELDAYDAYVAAYETYTDIDGRWVEFQFVYADANNFQLSTTETIDMDALVEEDMEH